MKQILLAAITLLTIASCQRYDEDVLEISGIYEANILGVSGPHSVSVAYDRGDEIIIDAPFDGFNWIVIYADVDDQQDRVKKIDIYDQEVGPNIFIWGRGTYFDGVLQLDYTIDFGYELIDFRLVGEQFY